MCTHGDDAETPESAKTLQQWAVQSPPVLGAWADGASLSLTAWLVCDDSGVMGVHQQPRDCLVPRLPDSHGDIHVYF